MAEASKPSLKSTLISLVVLAACVLVPFLFWQDVWFGQPLDDELLGSYLSSKENSRHVQHALTRISERLLNGDQRVREWYPQVARLVEHPEPRVRVSVAWLLGQDPESQLFHDSLLSLLEDSDPLVSRNAALSLVRFGDIRALPRIRTILIPQSITAGSDGTLVDLWVGSNQAVSAGDTVGRIEAKDGGTVEIQATLGGTVLEIEFQEGSRVEARQSILVLAPDQEHVWEALRALYLLGEASDIPLIQKCMQENSFSDLVQDQAQNTIEAIRRRNR